MTLAKYPFLMLFIVAVLPAVDSESVDVSRAIDGVTMVVSIDGKEERVRLLYVDLPARMPAVAAQAKACIERNTKGGIVLSNPSDTFPRDGKGQILALVHQDELKTDTLQGILIRCWFCSYSRKSGDAPGALHAELLKLENEAKYDGAGMWVNCPESKRPEPELLDGSQLREELKSVSLVRTSPLSPIRARGTGCIAGMRREVTHGQVIDGSSQAHMPAFRSVPVGFRSGREAHKPTSAHPWARTTAGRPRVLRMRRPTLLLLVALGLLAGGCSRRAESSTGAGMRPASMTGTSGIDRTSSESPRYHRYDP